MHRDYCPGVTGLCDAMKPTNGTELLKYLRKVDFQGLSGDRFHFDENGDAPARYKIKHFKQVKERAYEWITVGEYIEGVLTLNMSGEYCLMQSYHAGSNHRYRTALEIGR
ncbi:unnamed protein product [Acanthoscelides obtectus]|nr:unnamed protein product [Acanthoscelides obtectus]CAK1663456.1 Metabotropic glutamate receptor 5 [Acanthoscelides obtectus]